MKKVIILIVAVGVALTSASVCFSQSAEEFYRTNSVLLVVNGGVGGGTDFSARCLAKYWEWATGGPTMQVRVMPGGGGIEGLNYVHSAKPDGLTIGVGSHRSDFTGPPLLGGPGAKFDIRTLSFIGSFGRSPSVLLLDIDSPYKTLDDLRKAESKLIFGASNPRSGSSVAIVVTLEVLDLNSKVVHGYEVPEMGLATKRGEIAGYAVPASVAIRDMGKGFVKPFTVVTAERSAWFPDLPLITELADMTPQKKLIMDFVSALDDSKTFFTPPGFPEDKLEYLRRTFDKIMANQDFVKTASARFARWQKPLTGEEVEEMTKKALGMPREQVEAVVGLFKKHTK